MNVVGDPSTDFQSMPAIKSTLAPGQSARFEMYFRAAHDDSDAIYYMNGDGAPYSAAVSVSFTDDAHLQCDTAAEPGATCADTFDHANQVWNTNFVGPEETDTFDSSQPERQEYWVDQLCATGAATTCTFRPGSISQYDAPSREANRSYMNNDDVAVIKTLKATDTINVSDTLGFTATDNLGITAPLEAVSRRSAGGNCRSPTNTRSRKR